jgi:hypothetical protein
VTEITVDGHVASAIYAAVGPVRLLDANGRYLGRLVRDSVTPEDIVEARARAASDQPRYTTTEVVAYLDGLVSK